MAPLHLIGLLRERAARHPERTAMRYRAEDGWRDISWREVDSQVRAVAAALVGHGVDEQRMVGICSPNRPEWTVADLGCLSARAVPVPIYPSSTADQAGYVVRDAEINVLFVGGAEALARAREVSARVRPLTIVSFDDLPDLASDHGELSFSALLETGRRSSHGPEVEARLARVTADDLLTLIYTSGTTGEPKGVILSQSNFMACREIHDLRLPEVDDTDCSLCFLPLSHVFERCWTYYVLYRGMVNHYLEDPTRAAETLKEVRPTVMCVVPRLLEKIHSAIHARLRTASPLRQRLFHWAIRTGHEHMLLDKDERPVPLSLKLRNRLADRLVLGRLRALLGGRLKLMPCAGAPLSREVEEFFYSTGVRIAHGYGLTETTATVSFHERKHFRFGTVGRPMPRVEVRIGDHDEIQVKGPTVMKGYYKKPEATAEAFIDGWFRTGDAGAVDDAGNLVVTDRIKDLIKTSGGKYIAPQVIEGRLCSDPLVEQVAVVGDLRKYVAALVVPAFAMLETVARERGIPFASHEELIARPEVVALYQERVDAANRELARFEQVKRFTLLPRALSVDFGELTPTLKIKRKAVNEKYRALVDAMYPDA